MAVLLSIGVQPTAVSAEDIEPIKQSYKEIAMSKQMYQIKLTGVIDGKPAKTHQADECVIFTADGPKGTKDYFRVDHSVEGSPVMITPLGVYPLVWSRSGQYYEPKEDLGVKIHVTLKATVGRVVYWA